MDTTYLMLWHRDRLDRASTVVRAAALFLDEQIDSVAFLRILPPCCHFAANL